MTTADPSRTGPRDPASDAPASPPSSLPPPSPLLRGAGWALLAIGIWSGWFVVTRLTLVGGGVLGPLDLVALRFGISGLLFAPYLARRARALPRAAWREALWITAGTGAPFALLITLGLARAPAAHAAALTPGTMPLFAAGFGALMLGDRPGWLRGAGLALIAGGALTLAGGVGGGEELAGHGLFLLAAALWGLATVRLRASGLSALDATALACVLSLGLYLPPYLLSGASRLAAAPAWELLVQAPYQGVLASAVALLAFNRAVALIGPRAPGFTALVPVLATLMAVPALGEVPTAAEALAVALVALGVALSALGGGRRA